MINTKKLALGRHDLVDQPATHPHLRSVAALVLTVVAVAAALFVGWGHVASAAVMQPAASVGRTAGPDLDCSDIAERNFPVGPSDPNNFDRDHDGIGCESDHAGGSSSGSSSSGSGAAGSNGSSNSGTNEGNGEHTSGTENGQLPVTGESSVSLAVAGAILVVVGGLIVVTTRRRQHRYE